MFLPGTEKPVRSTVCALDQSSDDWYAVDLVLAAPGRGANGDKKKQFPSSVIEEFFSESGRPVMNMHLMTSLIIVFGFAFAVCLGLVKMIRDLSQASVHASPAIRENSTELSDAQ
jgi:hypothetical protein